MKGLSLYIYLCPFLCKSAFAVKIDISKKHVTGPVQWFNRLITILQCQHPTQVQTHVPSALLQYSSLLMAWKTEPDVSSLRSPCTHVAYPEKALSPWV